MGKHSNVLEEKVVPGDCVSIRAVIMLEGEKLGEHYDGEIVVNSEGAYIYRCKCGSTSIGNLNEISLLTGKIICLDCDTNIGAAFLVGRKGPQVYKVYGPGRKSPPSP